MLRKLIKHLSDPRGKATLSQNSLNFSNTKLFPWLCVNMTQFDIDNRFESSSLNETTWRQWLCAKIEWESEICLRKPSIKTYHPACRLKFNASCFLYHVWGTSDREGRIHAPPTHWQTGYKYFFGDYVRHNYMVINFGQFMPKLVIFVYVQTQIILWNIWTNH